MPRRRSRTTPSRNPKGERMNPITLLEFAQAERQYSRTGHQEFMWASNLRCRRYTVPAQAFLGHRVFPVWRTSKDGTKYMGRFEDSRIVAFAITYATLATKPSVFPAITFDLAIDYFAATAANPVIVYHCEGCGVHVVKDGSHRLLYCA